MRHITNCPRCRADVPSTRFTERGGICPHCRNPLADVDGLGAADVDTDVRRGRWVGTAVLHVCIAANVGGIGACFTLFGPRLRPLQIACAGGLFFLLAGLVCLAVVPRVISLVEAWVTEKRFGRGTPDLVLALVAPAVILGIIVLFFSACQGLLALR